MDGVESLASIDNLLARVGVIAVLILATWLVITLVRGRIDRRRALALAAPAFPSSSSDGQEVVRILAFSSDDCAQCHRLQTPALARVQALRGELVKVIDVDAPTSPELTERYAVLTLPTTVVLAPDGRASAVNYGFANSERLLQQCDELPAFGGKPTHAPTNGASAGIPGER